MSEAPARPQNLVIAELGEVGYQQWRHHPITKGFLQFLADQAREYEGAAIDLWESGRITDPNPAPHMNPQMLRGRYLALKELTDLPLEVLKAFYGIEDEPKQQEQDTKS